MRQFTISDFMTATPHCIEPNEPVSIALKRMREFKIRHLPVRSAGKVVGLITERDLEVLTTKESQTTSKIRVGDVMVSDPYCTAPNTPIREAAKEMATKKLGSILVVDESQNIVGVFTGVDACHALAELT